MCEILSTSVRKGPGRSKLYSCTLGDGRSGWGDGDRGQGRRCNHHDGRSGNPALSRGNGRAPPLNLTAAEVVLDGELCSKPPQWLAESDDSGFTIAFLTS